MNRRDFLKRSIAALAMAAIALNIDHCQATQQAAKPIRIVKGLPSAFGETSLSGGVGRIAFGGNLFTAYARGRFSVDAAEIKVNRMRQLLWKGAY